MATKTTKPIPKTEEEKYVTVIIPKPAGVIGDTETTVSVNGKMYQIIYDHPVSVPLNVAQVIEASKNLQAKIVKETQNAILKAGKSSIADL